jgi:hypothetical protein
MWVSECPYTPERGVACPREPPGTPGGNTRHPLMRMNQPPARTRLTIGEVFRHDDPVAHWMFSLTALAEDLEVGVEPSRQAIADGDLRALLFWHRHTATRLYEANRLVHPATSNKEIKEFVGDLLERAPGGATLSLPTAGLRPTQRRRSSRCTATYAT